jgi:tetratricopeptide (TPR) repeat protein
MIPDKEDWTVIFSKDAASWGAFWYDAKNDALRVKVKPVKSEYHEWLDYEFTEREPAKATLALKWEELAIPVSISVDDVNGLWAASLRKELRGSAGFSWTNWQQAANWCATNKVNLPEALKWAERAVSDPTWSGGSENFMTLTTLSRLQSLNGKDAESQKTFEKALNHPTATAIQIHQAGRQLGTDGKKQEPNQWPVHVGLMRGYAALGDRKKAIEEAKLAIPQAPDEVNKKNLQNLLKQLEEGKEIN